MKHLTHTIRLSQSPQTGSAREAGRVCRGIGGIRGHRGSRGHQGITLIEMMVALAITTFVVLVINQLFNSVIETVARGTQAGELLQKARTLDEQLAFESELQINNDATVPVNWLSRMVGPGGRDGTPATPGGFFAIVQRTVDAPLTVQDGIRGNTRTIRSDQLMFIYDQQSPLDAGTRRMPTMAPASAYCFTGDERDSMNAEYVRMWYGHVLQIRDDDDPTSYNMTSGSSYANLELGNTTGSGNPNILAQDWVLGRHALFLTDPSLTPVTVPPTEPYAPYVNFPLPIFNVVGISSGNPRLANGVSDVANITLDGITGATGLLGVVPNFNAYHSTAITMMFTQAPLLTAAQPMGNSGEMRAWDMSPSHTYFMGGVSDYIVEYAGDLVNDHFTGPINPTLVGEDGELDRDGQGRIKWYTALGPNNPARSDYDEDKPITYAAPNPSLYIPHVPPGTVNTFFSGRPNYAAGNQAAFVWQHDGSPGFTQWPWMIRVRYRLHDRQGNFQGREVTNSSGDKELEPGQWFETIIPVNYQNLR